MARKLENQINVDAPSSDYPLGRIRNNDGSGNGTPVSEEVYGDMHQFFARLMQIGNVPPNGLPDNAYSGFQLFEALLNTILFRIHGWSPTDIKIVPIGNWDMDATVTIAVAHGLNSKLIRNIWYTIRDDADTVYYSGVTVGSGNGLVQVGTLSIDSTNVNISRLTGGTFDTTGFDTAVFNRGFMIIEYLRA